MTKQLDTQDWGKGRNLGWKRNVGVFSIFKVKVLEDIKRVSISGKEIQMANPWGISVFSIV